MEVHGRQPGRDLPREQYLERQAELQRANQERVRQAREILVDLARRRQERLRDSREAQLSESSAEAERAREEKSSEARAERVERPQRDVIELSGAARDGGADDTARAERVARFREEHLAGTLNTPERIEQAAQNLLEG